MPRSSRIQNARQGMPLVPASILPNPLIALAHQELGNVTMYLPEQDKYLVSKNQLLDRISTALGGRVAEEIVYGEVWTGAVNDLEHVTRISRAMVCEYGMSERLGTLAIGNRHHNPFLGRDYADERNYSEDIAKVIDEEVHAIVEKCHSRATEILTTYREPLDAVVQALLERETLNREDFLKVMKGQALEPLAKGTPPPQLETPVKEVERTAKSAQMPPRLEPGTA